MEKIIFQLCIFLYSSPDLAENDTEIFNRTILKHLVTQIYTNPSSRILKKFASTKNLIKLFNC